MDGFRYLDQWYFDYCVYCTINNALQNQWSEISGIGKKCMVLLDGSLDTGVNSINRKKAQMLIIIIFCDKILAVGKGENSDGGSILSYLEDLANNLKSLYDLLKDEDDLKLCLITALHYGLQLCSDEDTHLTVQEREHFERECITMLKTLTGTSKLRKTSLTVSTVVKRIVEVISKKYNTLSTPYIMELLQEAQEDELDAELRELDADTQSCPASHLDRMIVDCGGDPEADLTAEVEAIKEKLSANKEVHNFITRRLNKTNLITPPGLNSSHLNLGASEQLESTSVQTHSSPSKIVSCQTEISRTTSDIVPPPGPPLTSSTFSGDATKSPGSDDALSAQEEDESNDENQPKAKKNSRNGSRVVSSSSDSPESDFTDHIFNKKLKPVNVRPSLVNFKSLSKPPSSDIVHKGRWTREEEEKLLEATFKYGEGNWTEIKKAMNSLRTSQQLKDKWRNIPSSRKKAFNRQNTNK